MNSISPRSVILLVAAVAPAFVFIPLLSQIQAAVGKEGVLALSWLALIWSLAVILLYWRGIDEVARDAQKTAWFWGGLGGIVIGSLALSMPVPLQDIFANAISDATLSLREGATRTTSGVFHFLAGAIYILFAQALGYFVFWIGWWIVKR